MGKSDCSGQKKNLHANHRQRLQKLYQQSEGAGLTPHQLLELLLFYSIPRRDTNPTAHLLMDAFGSVSNLLSRPREELLAVEGIGPASAGLIELVAKVRRRVLLEQQLPSKSLKNLNEVLRHLKSIFSQETSLGVYLLLIDGRGRPLVPVRVQEAVPFLYEPAATQRVLRCIYAQATPREVKGVVLVERRPGSGVPSTEDLFATRKLRRCLEQARLQLIDHVIFFEQRCISMSKLNML